MSTLTIGQAIRATYEAAGLSQVALAERLGFDQPRISRYVRDVDRPGLDILVAIDEACGVERGHVLRRAGYVEAATDVRTAIRADTVLDEVHKDSLVDLYEVFLKRSAR